MRAIDSGIQRPHACLGENHTVSFFPNAMKTVRGKDLRQLFIRNGAKLCRAPWAEAAKLSGCRMNLGPSSLLRRFK